MDRPPASSFSPGLAVQQRSPLSLVICSLRADGADAISAYLFEREAAHCMWVRLVNVVPAFDLGVQPMASDDEFSRQMQWAADQKAARREQNHALAQQSQIDSWQIASAHGSETARDNLLWSGQTPWTSEPAEKKKVICTELYSQGRMSQDDYRLCSEDASSRISEQTYRGYHVWAIPVVKAMRNSRHVSALMAFLAMARVDEIAARRGDLSRKNLLGALLIAAGEPLCRLIGAFVAKSDYNALYGGH